MLIEKCVGQVFGGIILVGAAPSDVQISYSSRGFSLEGKQNSVAEDGHFCCGDEANDLTTGVTDFPILYYSRPSREILSHLLCTQSTVRFL